MSDLKKDSWLLGNQKQSNKSWLDDDRDGRRSGDPESEPDCEPDKLTVQFYRAKFDAWKFAVGLMGNPDNEADVARGAAIIAAFPLDDMLSLADFISTHGYSEWLYVNAADDE